MSDDVIISAAWTSNGPMYRLFGDSRRPHTRSLLHTASTSHPYRRLIAHCEGTTARDTIKHVIGSGRVRNFRQLAPSDYTIGTDINNLQRIPPVIDTSTVCCMAYDIEEAYNGEVECNVYNEILCVTMKCSFGQFNIVVSRAPVHIEGVECVIKVTNKSITHAVFFGFVKHAPTFIYRHNILLYYNMVLALSLPDDDPLVPLFIPITDKHQRGYGIEVFKILSWITRNTIRT